MAIGKICERHVDVVRRDETVCEAAERMHQHAVGALVVIDDQRRPIGIMTDRDLVERCLARRMDPNLVKAADVMTSDPAAISEDASVGEALRMMREGSMRRLPVVDDQGQLAGVISLDDILMLLADEFGWIGDLLRSETPRGIAELSSR